MRLGERGLQWWRVSYDGGLSESERMPLHSARGQAEMFKGVVRFDPPWLAWLERRCRRRAEG